MEIQKRIDAARNLGRRNYAQRAGYEIRKALEKANLIGKGKTSEYLEGKESLRWIKDKKLLKLQEGR